MNYKLQKKKTLNFQVYEMLKTMIQENYFKEDTKLNEVKIAELLDVSPTPVREAFRMLAVDGMVEIIPWKGVYIKQYSLEEIREVYECREALEVLAVQLCIEHISDREIDELIQSSMSHGSDQHSIIQLSNQFHDQILTHAHNQRLRSLLTQLQDVMNFDRKISASDQQRYAEIEQEHRDILLAIQQRDKDLAAMCMKKHIRNGFAYISKCYDSKE